MKLEKEWFSQVYNNTHMDILPSLYVSRDIINPNDLTNLLTIPPPRSIC